MTAVRKAAGERAAPATGLRGIKELLALAGEDFTREAYRRLLGREPDPTGFAAYTPRASTLWGRLTILAGLLTSPEQDRLPPWLGRLGYRIRYLKQGRR